VVEVGRAVVENYGILEGFSHMKFATSPKLVVVK